MTPIEAFYQQQSATIIENLEKRQIAGYYCPSKEAALDLALSLTDEGSTIGFGGSMTLVETGLLDALKVGNYKCLDRGAATSREEVLEIYQASFAADTYFMSSNAITLDGQLVNIDGNGNRVAALIYGPKQVILMVGMNKVAPDVDSAIKRVRHTAGPANAIRLDRATPCTKTGHCHDCQSPECICSNTVITRRSAIKNRLKVILIGDVLGY